MRPLGLLGLFLVSPSLRDAAAAEGDRPPLRARQVEVAPDAEVAALAEATRLQSIEMLKGLIAGEDADPPRGERRAEMLLRLGDLSHQQARAVRLREMAAFDAALAACDASPGCDGAALRADHASSTAWEERAVALFRQVLDGWPRYARADEAMFYLASALVELGDTNGDPSRLRGAHELLERFVAQYPDSRLAPDAWVAIGEHHFEAGVAYKALTAYRRAAAWPDHELHVFALYKLGWSYFNVGEHEAAIDALKAVVAASGEDGARLRLGDEALRDLARFFAEADALDDAVAYYTGLGRADVLREMLPRVADAYVEQGRWERAIQAWRRLIAEAPASPDAPRHHVEIARAWQRMGRRDDALAELDRMLATYRRDSAWGRANAGNPEVLETADALVEAELRALAFAAHAEARKLGTGAPATAARAAAQAAYRAWLGAFPADPNAYEVRFGFAELLYELKRVDEAHAQYMAVVATDPAGRHSRFAAEAAIFAADELAKREAGATSAAGGTAPLPLTPSEERLVEACAQYARLYDDDRVKSVLYRSAYLLYDKRHYPEAADQFRAVIARDPASREAEQAANLILDSFVVGEDWANLQKNARFFFEQPGLGSPAFKREVHTVYERASLKIVEVELARTGDASAAADALVAFTERFPGSAEVPRALNNAAVYYHQAGRVADAMAVRHRLVEDPRLGEKTPYLYEHLAGLGYDYETIADFGRAAAYYEAMFAEYRARPEGRDRAAAADALYSAAVFRRALGDAKLAMEDFGAFSVTFRGDDRAEDARLAVGRMHEEQGQWSQALAVYTGKPAEKAGPDHVLYARLRQARCLEALGQGAKAARVYEESVATFRDDVGAPTELLAEMMFELARADFERYAALDITGAAGSRAAEERAIQRSLEAKKDALVELERQYAAILKTGSGAWGVAALVMLGRVYEDMGASLRASHVPGWLTEEQRELYGLALEDRAWTQDERAVSAYEAALAKSRELTVYDERTAEAARRLAALRPDRHPEARERVPVVVVPSTSVRVFGFETSYGEPRG